MTDRSHAVAVQAAIAAEGQFMVLDAAVIDHVIELSDAIRIDAARLATVRAEAAAKAAADAALAAKLAEDEAILAAARGGAKP